MTGGTPHRWNQNGARRKQTRGGKAVKEKLALALGRKVPRDRYSSSQLTIAQCDPGAQTGASAVPTFHPALIFASVLRCRCLVRYIDLRRVTEAL
jgi:hypothetical protein